MAKGTPLDLTIRILGKMDKSLTAALGGAQRQVSSLAQTVSGIGTVGLAAMGAFAAGTVTALVKCTDAAGEFENQMSDVVKYVSGLADSYGQISDTAWDINAGGNGKTYAENYAEMKDALLDLSTQIPMTAEELAQLAAAAGQSGKSMSDIISRDAAGNVTGFLRDAARMGTAWDISAQQAGDYAAKWEAAFGMSHEQIMVLADQINYLGANSATTAAEIAGAVNAAASLGQIGGVDVATTAAIADAMLATGVSADRVGTSIKRMITNFSLGSSASKVMQGQWAELGFTAEEIAKSMQEDSVETLNKIFEAIGALPDERQVAALKNLFGQWAIEGGAKIVGNMDVYRKALAMVSDPSLYEGSMEREFIIKASTSGALDTMMKNAFFAFRENIGDKFLDQKKEVSLAVIDFLNQLRNMPELGQVAEQLAELFSNGITWAGDALQEAMPKIQTGLDYLINNGPKVRNTLLGIVAALTGMKFAPTITTVLGGVGNLLFSPAAGAAASAARGGGLFTRLFRGGQSATGTFSGAATIAREAFGNARLATSGVNGGLLGGIANGGAGVLATLLNARGLLSGNEKAASDARDIISALVTDVQLSGGGSVSRLLLGERLNSTGAGRYLGNVGAAAGNFLNRSGILPGLQATGGVAWEVLKSIAGPGNELGQGLNLTGAWEGIRNAGAGAASWIGGRASAITQSRPVQAVTGIVGNVVNSAPVQAIAGWAGGTLTSGAQLLGTAAGPMLSGLLSGLGGIVAGAAPVVLAISGIIAVLSLLDDKFNIVGGIFNRVFGEEGPDKLKNFKTVLDNVLNGDGVLTAWNGLRERIFGVFEDGSYSGGLLSGFLSTQTIDYLITALNAAMPILQSVMGFVGQIVNFATTTVKPMIAKVFGFIAGTVMPTLLDIFTSAAPTISSIITGVGNIIMTVVQGIMLVLSALWPSIQRIVGVVLNVAEVAIPVLLGAINLILPVIQGIISVSVPVVTVAVSAVVGLLSGLAQSIGEIAAGIVRTFGGIIDFVSGVFTGDWGKAWNGVKDIFGGVFDALAGLCKVPMNAVIGIINGAINGINGISFDVPEWVPLLGGKHFGGFNLPTITMLARGGFTNGPSIAGEAGTEAVISFQPGVRTQNIGTWTRAGEMLGVLRPLEDAGGTFRLREIPAGAGAGGGSGFNITFAPNINIHGNADRQTVDAALVDSERRFQTWIEQNFETLYSRMERQRSRTGYA